MADGGDQEGQLIGPSHTIVGFRCHQEEVRCMENVCGVRKVMVRVVFVVAGHPGYPERQCTVVQFEILYHARVHEDVKHHNHLQEAARLTVIQGGRRVVFSYPGHAACRL